MNSAASDAIALVTAYSADDRDALDAIIKTMTGQDIAKLVVCLTAWVHATFLVISEHTHRPVDDLIQEFAIMYEVESR